MEHGIVIQTDGKRRKVDVGDSGHRGPRGHNEHGRQIANSFRKGDLREMIENNRRGNYPPEGDREPDLRVYLRQLKGQQERHLVHDSDLHDPDLDDSMDEFLRRERNSDKDMYMHHGDQFGDVHMGPSDGRRQGRSVEKYDIFPDRSDGKERFDAPYNNPHSRERRNRSFTPDKTPFRHNRQTDTPRRFGSQSDRRMQEEFQMDDFDRLHPDHYERRPRFPEEHYERRGEYPEDLDRMGPDERFRREEHYRRFQDERQESVDGERRMHDRERNREMIFDEDPRSHSSRFEEDGKHVGYQQEGGMMHRREGIDGGGDWRERSHSQSRHQLDGNDRSRSERNRYGHDDNYLRNIERQEYERNEELRFHAKDSARFPPNSRERFRDHERNRMHHDMHEEEMHSDMLRRRHSQEFERMHAQDHPEMHHHTHSEDTSRYKRNGAHFDDPHESNQVSGRRSFTELDRVHPGERETMRRRMHPDDEDRRHSHDSIVPERRHLFNPDDPDGRDEFNFNPRINSHGSRNRFSPNDERRQHSREMEGRSPDSYRKGSVERYQSHINQNAHQYHMDSSERNPHHRSDSRFEDERRKRDGIPIPSDYHDRLEKGRSKGRVSPRQSKLSRSPVSPRPFKRSRSPVASPDGRNPKRRSMESEISRRGDNSYCENQSFPNKKRIQNLNKQEVGVHSRESVERHFQRRAGDTNEERKASQMPNSSHRIASNHDRNSGQFKVNQNPLNQNRLNSRSDAGGISDSWPQDHSIKTPSKGAYSSEKIKGEKSTPQHSKSPSGKPESLQSQKFGKRNAIQGNSGNKGRFQNHSPKPKKNNPQLGKVRTPPCENVNNSTREDKISSRNEDKHSQTAGHTGPRKFDLDAEISRSLAAYRKSSEENQLHHKDTVISTPPAEALSEDIDGVPLSNAEYLNLIQSQKEPPKPPSQPSKKTPVSIKLAPLPSRQIGVNSSIFATPGMSLGNIDSSSIRNESFDMRSKYDNDNLSQLSQRPNLMDTAKLPSFETEYPYSRSGLQSHCSDQTSSSDGNNGNNVQAIPAEGSSYDGIWEKLPSVVGSSSQSFEQRNPHTLPGFGSVPEKALAPVLQLDDSYFDALKKTLSRIKDIETGANKDENVDQSGHVSSSSSNHSNNEMHLNEFRDLGVEEKLNAIRFFVRYYTPKNVDDVNLIDLAINKDYQGGVKLEKDYKVRVLGQEKERVVFIGTLYIGGQFFADAIHQFKRECKRLCHAKAVKVCRECTMEGIRALKPRSAEELKKAMSELIVDLVRTEDKDPLNVIKRFIKSLKNAKNVPMNVISKIMNAVNTSGIGSRFCYSDEILRDKSKQHLCKGELKVAGITIGISAEASKQKAKAATMEMAYKRLMLCPAEKIVQGLNSKELEEGLAKMNSVGDKSTQNSNLVHLKQTLDKLIDTLKTEAADTGSSCLAKIEKFCKEFKLSPYCVYKKTDRMDSKRLMIMLCELYINEYFVGSGTGTSRNQSKKEAFNNAHAFMLSTNAQQLILKQRKLTQADLTSPDVLHSDNVLAAMKRESNIKLLKNYNPNEITCAVKDIVIVETPALVKNRYQNAFKIIQQSCNHAQMLMEWEFEPVGSVFKFHIFIQGQEVSSNDIMAPTKYRAKVLSCAEVLYGFYETQPVIEVIREYDTCGSFSESDIEQQVKMMQMSGMEVDDIPEDILKEVDEDMDVSKLKWYYAVFNGMFSIYSKEDTLEEITFGPNFKDLFLFKHFKEKYNIRISTVKREGDIYYVATPMLLPSQMYGVLKKSGGESGRYRIVNKLLLPRKVDLQEEIRLAENAASSTDASLVNKFKRETENLNNSVTEPSKYILRTASLCKSPGLALNKPKDTCPERSLATSPSSSVLRPPDSVGRASAHTSVKRGEFGSSVPVSGQYYPSYTPNSNSFSGSP